MDSKQNACEWELLTPETTQFHQNTLGNEILESNDYQTYLGVDILSTLI